MCGIAGVVDATHRTSADHLRAVAAAMGATLGHRGPDDHGVWVDPAAGVALAHRRLAVVDVSDRGRQPMVSAGGRYTLTFNGEIYGHGAVRERLAGLGHAFRGTSDTEVLVAAIEEWGVRGALERVNGMFAIAVWDGRDRLLHLACDRFGEKPLAYGFAGRAFVFASEVRALWQHPDFEPAVDPVALAELTRHAYVPAPRSIFEGVAKLEPGTHLVVDPRRGEPVVEPYWSARTAAERAAAAPITDEGDARDEIDGRLRRAVRLRMDADVPLGALLSGGIDSSLVVALMQAQSTRPVRTFTIGFETAAHQEAPFAREVARHLGTEHAELLVSETEVLSVVPRLGALYDEPFADSSQIPTVLVSRLARGSVTVALSGDGADELFGGYPRYHHALRLERLLGRVSPAAAPRVASSEPGSRQARVAALLEPRHPVDRYVDLLAYWTDADGLVREPAAGESIVRERLRALGDELTAEQLLLGDTLTYLPGDLLTKVDRASMAVGLEVRAPFLDPDVFDVAWRLPAAMRLGTPKRTKALLRSVLAQYVPPELFERPKHGFSAPIDVWLRGPLRDWASDLLAPSAIEADGFFDAAVVGRAWREHLDGTRDWHYPLWPVLLFGAWLREQPRSLSRR